MKALRLTNDENEKRAKAAQNTCKHSVLYCMALWLCMVSLHARFQEDRNAISILRDWLEPLH